MKSAAVKNDLGVLLHPPCQDLRFCPGDRFDSDHFCKFTAKDPHAKNNRWDDEQTATFRKAPTHIGKVKCHINAIKGIPSGFAVRSFQIPVVNRTMAKH